MGLSVNTNIAAMNAYRNLATTNDKMNQSLERLSSGYRINRAADDAAGLAISEGLQSQIGGMTQAVQNTQDATSVVQTAEGALNETTSILQRMRDLSVQASNSGSMNSDALSSIQKEIGQLKDELTRISNTTTFNGTKLLDGNFAKTFQVGANAGETISVAIGQAGKGMDAAGLGVAGVDVTSLGKYAVASAGTATGTVVASAANATTAGNLKFYGQGSDNFAGATSSLSSFQNLTGTISFNGKVLDLANVDYSSIDTTAAASSQAASALTALNNAADQAWGLASGTAVFTAATNILTFNASAAAPASATSTMGAAGVAKSNSAADVAAATPVYSPGGGAAAAITAIDAAITQVSDIRADLGAVQNRFTHTINNLNTAIENTTASESRIKDTDMASEMTKFTQAQVLQQAGTAMLAQANQSTQSILKLLGA
jgi:flagellin